MAINRVDSNFVENKSTGKTVREEIGELGSLGTSKKESLVSAINENVDNTNTIAQAVALSPNSVEDQYHIIQNVLDQGLSTKIVFPKNEEITISQPLDLTDSPVKVLDFNGCKVNAHNGAIIFDGHYSVRPTIRNAKFLGSGSNNLGLIGVRVGQNLTWGSSINLENVEIDGYYVGLYANCSYRIETKSMKIRACRVGTYLNKLGVGSDVPSFTNMVGLSDIYHSWCRYGIYVQNSKNISINNCITEDCGYGVVLGNSIENIEFNNHWSEKNRDADVTIGNYNLDTEQFEFSYDDRVLKEVKFKNTRYGQDSTYQPFLDPHFDFASKYYDFGNVLSNSHNTFKSNKLDYTNLVHQTSAFYNVGSGVSTDLSYGSTPFGYTRLYNFKGSPISANTSLSNRVGTDTIKGGDHILVKALVYIKPIGQLKIHSLNTVLTNSNGVFLSDGFKNDTPILTNRWTEFNSIIIVKDDGSLDGSDKRLLIYPNKSYTSDPNSPNYELELDVTICFPMVVNLTTLFGKGNEPDRGMENFISNYLPYKPGFRPGQGEFIGQQYFDPNTGFLSFWNGSSWINLNV